VDQLMISEELSGKDLRTLAREYLSLLNTNELLYTNRESSLFELILPEFKKSVVETEEEIDNFLGKLKTSALLLDSIQ